MESLCNLFFNKFEAYLFDKYRSDLLEMKDFYDRGLVLDGEWSYDGLYFKNDTTRSIFMKNMNIPMYTITDIFSYTFDKDFKLIYVHILMNSIDFNIYPKQNNICMCGENYISCKIYETNYCIEIIETIMNSIYSNNKISLTSIIYNSVIDFDYEFINNYHISKNLNLSLFLNFNPNCISDKNFNRDVCTNELLIIFFKNGISL